MKSVVSPKDVHGSTYPNPKVHSHFVRSEYLTNVLVTKVLLAVLRSPHKLSVRMVFENKGIDWRTAQHVRVTSNQYPSSQKVLYLQKLGEGL